MKLSGLLTRLGSRTFIVGEIASVIMLAKSCAAPPPPCEGEACATGGSVASTSSSGGTGGSGGSAGDETTGTGATGGEGGATGGSGGSGGVGGSGTSSSGGSGGSGGCPVYECGAKDCGLVDNGCGEKSDCGGCGSPMACGQTHVCECAVAAEQGWCNSQYPVACGAVGGCVDTICPLPADPKFPEECQVFAPDGTACCPVRCDMDAECDDGNECTSNKCGADRFCKFAPLAEQTSCADGTGVCITGDCVSL